LALCVQMFELICPWSSLCRVCKTDVVIDDGITRSRLSLLCQQCHRRYHAKCLKVRVNRADAYSWLCSHCRPKDQTPEVIDDDSDEYSGSRRNLPERRAKQASQVLTREMLHDQMVPEKDDDSEYDDDDDDDEDEDEDESDEDEEDEEDDGEETGGHYLRRSSRLAHKALEKKKQRMERQQELEERSNRFGLRHHAFVDYTD